MVNYPNAYGTPQQNVNYYNPVTTPIVWVEAEQEARNAYVAPGATGFFMERQNPRFYVKSSTLSGEVASFKIFEFTEILPKVQAPAPETTTQYVTEDKFEASMNEIKQLINSKFGYRKNKEGDNRG